MPTRITVQTVVDAPLENVWRCWTEPNHIVEWSFASDDWEATSAENDLRPGGRFKTALGAKDKSAGFDFEGTYTVLEPRRRIEYTMDDGRHVAIEFEESPEGVRVTESFDAEGEHSEEMQRAGWQGFLDNFKKHAESC